MATTSQLHVNPSTPGVFPGLAGITADASSTASRLLQENHERVHIFYSENNFHNHIAHHLLSIFALGATRDELQHAFDINVDGKPKQFPIDETNVAAMADPEKFRGFLGQQKYFHDFEEFFAREMDRDPQGWRGVVKKYLLGRTESADDLLVRTYGGLLHPIIHLGFGIEFTQPAIIVEALAQAAVHENWIGQFFLPAEKAAQERQQTASTKTILSLFQALRANKKLSSAAYWSDGNKIRDGIMARAGEDMLEIASQYRLSDHPTDEELKKATAEMINANACFTMGAQREGKTEKVDFYLMHCLNCSIFYSAFLEHVDEFGRENIGRMLEWKVRVDLVMYASRGSPALDLARVSNYVPREGPDESWDALFHRANRFEDDGHLSKLIRALGNGEAACREFEGHDGFDFKSDMWKKAAQLALDSVEDCEDDIRWVRSAGFDEAWVDIPAKAKL